MGIDLLHSAPVTDTNISNCWIKNDANEWIYMCSVPDANGNILISGGTNDYNGFAVNQNTHIISN